MKLISVIITDERHRELQDGKIHTISTDRYYYCSFKELSGHIKRTTGIKEINIRIDMQGSSFLLNTDCDYSKFMKMVLSNKTATFVNSNEPTVLNCPTATITYSAGEYNVQPTGKPRFTANCSTIIDAMRMASQIKKQIKY